MLDIASEISKKASGRLVYVVGIDGPGGSGKSAFAEKLSQQFAALRVAVASVHNDDFYFESGIRSRLPVHLKPVGGDFDWIRLRDQVLVPLRSGKTAHYTRYDWASDRLAENHEVQPQGIILVEGVYSTRAELRELYDFRIWVECPRELRLSRGLARDGEAGRSRWVDDWMPAEDRYVDEHRPQAFADAIISGAAT